MKVTSNFCFVCIWFSHHLMKTFLKSTLCFCSLTSNQRVSSEYERIEGLPFFCLVSHLLCKEFSLAHKLSFFLLVFASEKYFGNKTKIIRALILAIFAACFFRPAISFSSFIVHERSFYIDQLRWLFSYIDD